MKREGDPNILPKSDEAIWFDKGKVVKYHKDSVFIKNRVIRSMTIEGFCPKITSSSDNFYSYDFINGDVFSNIKSIKEFNNLLSWLEKFWVEYHFKNEAEQSIFQEKCLEFYKDKTIKRIDLYFDKYDNIDKECEFINGVETPSIYKLLGHINCSEI